MAADVRRLEAQAEAAAVNPAGLKPGDRVTLANTGVPGLDGSAATVDEVFGWGCRLRDCVTATGYYRAAWGELVGMARPRPREVAGYTGDPCGRCGSPRQVRAGACLVCLDCGESGGCA